MKKYFFILSLLILINSCIDKEEVVIGGEEYIFNGKLYANCDKVKIYRNTPLEVSHDGLGLGGQKSKVLATTKTSEDGSFFIKFRANPNARISLYIPANDQLQIYVPIGIRLESPLQNMIDKDFYTASRTSIKVKLKCNRVYTNQDTLYITPKFVGSTTLTYEKIIEPKDSQVVLEWTQGGRVDITAGWGLGWADFQKMLNISDYNVITTLFPFCNNSPSEYTLEIK